MPRTFFLLLALTLAACDGGGGEKNPGCEPGSTASCSCEGGGEGLAPCLEDGSRGACLCLDAVQWTPTVLDFGEIRIGAVREATLLLWTAGPVAIPVIAATIEGDPGFRLVYIPDAIPAGGGGVPLVVSFTSTGPVVAEGRLLVRTGVGEVSVPLRIGAYGPVVVCTEEEVRWDDVPRGATDRQEVVCTNTGRAGGGNSAAAIFERIELDDPEFAFGAPDGASMGPGQSLVFPVMYRPEDLEDDLATAVVHFAGGIEAPIRLIGSAAVPVDCSLTLELDAISGVPGQELTGLVTLKNGRTDAPCVIESITPAPECAERGFDFLDLLDEGFKAVLPESPMIGRYVFHGEVTGVYTCELRVVADDPASTVVTATANAELSWWPCLVHGNSVSVPPVSPSCGASRTELAVTNVCGAMVFIDDVRIGEGSAPGFSVGPIEPVTLAPGQVLQIPVEFDAVEEGELFEARIEVVSSLDPEPLSIAVSSYSAPDNIYTDRMAQDPLERVDVLVVIDNGVGMAPVSSRLLAELGAAPDVLTAYDYHLAVTTTGLEPVDGAGCPGGADGGEDGRLFPVDGSRPRVVTRTTPDARAVWEQNLAVGACHTAPSRALEAAVLAVSPELNVADDPRYEVADDGNAGFLRDNTPLRVIVVSNRDDASPEPPAWYFASLVAAIKEDPFPFMVEVATVAGAPETGCTGAGDVTAEAGDRLHEFAEETWGIERSICDSTWGLMDLFPTQLGTCFRLRAPPADRNEDGTVDEDDLVVELVLFGVGPVVIPAVDPSGLRTWFLFLDDNDDEYVCFKPHAVPPPLTPVMISRLYCPAR